MVDKMKTEMDEVADEQLEDVSGGAIFISGAAKGSGEAGAIPDVCVTPTPGGSGIPIPYPNTGSTGTGTGGASVKVSPDEGGESGGT